MDILDYLLGEALILIPGLIIIGQIIKKIKLIPDKFIPVILLVIAIPAAMSLVGWTIGGAIQGVLVAGTAVYGNQIWKQLGKDE